ncbi:MULTISPECIES: acyl-CoA thioesterase [Halomonadaceae]|jgi:acyl-CoA thioester hydrolase|uniref:Thioesterase n=2 Tax=Halomonadaceae TaxID=28256 RepID=A0A2A2FB64_9GAMM|nr:MULTISPECIES: thioesterase family protein [Halomonadaceae]MYL25848.1 acyl-CoA thioesterase [Halomonas utahensis]MYL73590.1 acyl-CoA thioesterase [Halomonas sp. 22501_18_FS]PAU81964.1 thioesterase [Halovibrio salipaludis]
MAGDEPLPRGAFDAFQTITTRWHDNDLYGHVNNVTYYAWFDTAVNRFLIEDGGLDIYNGPVIAYVVSSGCEYYRSVAYPEPVEVGLRVERLGNSSVTWGIGVFGGHDGRPLAQGRFVHVFVNRATDEPTPIPGPLREAIERLGA